jgi:c-di-GMP-binding flagellar brake protein YcgR
MSGQDCEPTSGFRERRSFPRYTVDCPAAVTPLTGSGTMRGRLIDLSRGGCRLEMPERVFLGILCRVEVQFQLRGIAFRVVGVTAGTRTSQSFAVRFLDLPRRREQELAEVLAEVANLASGTQDKQAGETRLPPPPNTAISAPAPPAVPASAALPDSLPPSISKDKTAPNPPEPAPPETAKAPSEHRASDGRVSDRRAPDRSAPDRRLSDRRASNRHAVDTRANLILVKSAISMSGCILNLSLGGCRVRTDERFNVGIYTRLEAEFFLHGLPFRVGGVSQAILDKNTIGIRFLDMSDRRRDQLAELMAEIAEAEGSAHAHPERVASETAPEAPAIENL